MTAAAFERSVFVNCPFDDNYDPILQAILFCIVYLGFAPRIARERSDSGELRVAKITQLIEESRYSIHDLSRSQAQRKGDYFRLNIPFELGIDWACRRYYGSGRDQKRFLVLDEKSHRYQAALSDLAGWDIEYHEGDAQRAVRKVRNWLVSEAGIEAEGADLVFARYGDFQAWYYSKQIAAGFSQDDIEDYETGELLKAMVKWIELGEPIVATLEGDG